MNFNATIYERGRKYVQQKKIEIVKQTKNSYAALAYGSEVYSVSATLKNDKVVSMSCDCPYAKEGHYCKHEAALYQIILSNTKKENNSKNKISQNKTPEQVIKEIYDSLKYNRRRGDHDQFYVKVDDLFNKEKGQALKKYDKDVFKRWFEYAHYVNKYDFENYWFRYKWTSGLEDCVKQLMKNDRYKQQALPVFAQQEKNPACRDVKDMIKELVDEFDDNDRMQYELCSFELIEKDKQEEALYEILYHANQKGLEIFNAYLKTFIKYKYLFSYMMTCLICFPKEEVTSLYEEYKKKNGENIRLEAIFNPTESNKNKMYNTLALEMENKPIPKTLLYQLIKLYGKDWIHECEPFYKQIEKNIGLKMTKEVILGVDDWQYAAFLLLNNKGNRYKEDYMDLIKQYDKDLYYHLCLKTFINKMEEEAKSPYGWYGGIFREFYSNHGKESLLEALAYAKQYFSSRENVVNEINKELDELLKG